VGTSYAVQTASRPAGGSFGAAVDVAVAAKPASKAQVLVDRAGTTIVMWSRVVDSVLLTSVVQAASRPAGGSFGAPVDLSDVGSAAPDSQLATAPDGDTFAVWAVGGGTTGKIQSAEYDALNPELRGLSVPASGIATVPLSFAASPFDAGAGIASTGWGFGDGQSASGASVSHAFARAGTYSATVTVTDAAGNRTLAIRPVAIVAFPSLSRLAVSPRTFALTGRVVRGRCVAVTRANRARRRCARKVAVRIAFTSAGVARVVFGVRRATSGRSAGRRCVALTRANRGRKRCTRLMGVKGTFTRKAVAGTSRFTYDGRLGGHRLRAGSYRLTATPSVGRATGRPRTVTLTLTR
jgi:hypothetical protein